MISWLSTLACGLATAVLVAYSSSQGASARQEDSAEAAFARHREQLLTVGLHERDGWIFSTAQQSLQGDVPRQATDRIESRLRLQSLAQMSRARFDSILRSTDFTPPVRLAAAEAADRCFGGAPWSAAGVLTVMAEESGQTFVVVCALPRASLLSAQVTVQQLLDCLRRQAKERTLTMKDAMVLREMERSGTDAASSAADETLLDAFDRTLGRGISLTARSSWTLPDGSTCPECLQAWSVPAARAASEGLSVRDALLPVPEKVARGLPIDEALPLLGKRAHDRSLHAAILERLRKDGWLGCAKSLDAAPLPVARLGESPDGTLPAASQAELLEVPLIMSMLLSDGRAQPRLSVDEPADMRAAITLLSGQSANAVPKAIGILAKSLSKSPSSPAAKLLAQLLLVQREPALARALAQAAVASGPEDGFAHMLLLRAERQIGSKDAVAALVPKILQGIPLKPEWKAEAEAAGAWAGVELPAVP